MKKVSTLLIVVSLLVVIGKVDSGLLGTRYQLDNRPDCIWILYPQYPRHPSGRTTTVAPTTIPPAAATATEAPETTPAPESEDQAPEDAGGEATEAAPSDVEEVTVAEDGAAK